MIRRSRTWAERLPLLASCALGCALAGCAFGAGGCASSGGFTTASELPTGKRRPDGVAIDPASSPPPPRDRADAAEGMITLRTPLGVDRAVDTIHELFRKVVVEDSEGVEQLFTREATFVSPGSQGGQTPLAAAFWNQRFHRLDYTRLAGEPIFRDAEIEIYRADDALDAPPHPGIHLEALGDGDVVIRVPILTARVGADRLLGDEIVFWLRRDNDRFRIYRMMEDFQLS